MNDREGCVLHPVRGILQVESALVLAALAAAYWLLHASWLLFVVLLLAPDLAMLGYVRNTRIGAWCYNAFHTYAGPVVLAAIAIPYHWLLPFAVIWAAHIAMDRALGYGLKYNDAFGHTHLGTIGRTSPPRSM